MSETLRIAIAEETRNAPVTVLQISGDLDGKSYHELEAKAGEAIAKGSTNILLDLGGVNYMGSAGLRALHSISNKVKGSGQMRLLNPSEAVARVMKTLGFDKVFSIHHDYEEALKAF